MSEENTQTDTTPVTETPAAEAPAKRPRGRPKGSKNKPKPEGFVAPPRKPRATKVATAPAAVVPATQTRIAKVSTVFVAPTEDTEDVVESSVETTDITD